METDLYLIVPNSGTRNELGVFVPPAAPVKRHVLGFSSGVRQSEWATAGVLGFRPEMTITVPFVDYNGEQAAEVGGVTYAIYRTYLVNNDWDVELHLGTRVGVSM